MQQYFHTVHRLRDSEAQVRELHLQSVVVAVDFFFLGSVVIRAKGGTFSLASCAHLRHLNARAPNPTCSWVRPHTHNMGEFDPRLQVFSHAILLAIARTVTHEHAFLVPPPSPTTTPCHCPHSLPRAPCYCHHCHPQPRLTIAPTLSHNITLLLLPLSPTTTPRLTHLAKARWRSWRLHSWPSRPFSCRFCSGPPLF